MPPCFCTGCEQDRCDRKRRRRLSARRVRRYRRFIAREACPLKWGIRHRWAFDGYFWYRCIYCGRVE